MCFVCARYVMASQHEVSTVESGEVPTNESASAANGVPPVGFTGRRMGATTCLHKISCVDKLARLLIVRSELSELVRKWFKCGTLLVVILLVYLRNSFESKRRAIGRAIR